MFAKKFIKLLLLLITFIWACGGGSYARGSFSPYPTTEHSPYMAQSSEGTPATMPSVPPPEMVEESVSFDEEAAGGMYRAEVSTGNTQTQQVQQPGQTVQNQIQTQPQNQQPQIETGESRAPLLIYEANLYIAVNEVADKITKIVQIADEVGGFLARQTDNSVVIRVPADRFREALSKCEATGDVLHKTITVQDVSDQVRDLRIRLRNATQMRDQLAQLLQRAQSVADSLAIERELERLTEAIELMEGQLRAFQDRIAFSTIIVQFQPVQLNENIPEERFRLPFYWLNELGLGNLLGL